MSTGDERPADGLPGSTAAQQSDTLTQGQNQVLEMIAAGAPLAETLASLARAIEAQSPGMLCSILLLDNDGIHLRHGAAPSLPDAYVRALDGIAIGPYVGSCGTAVTRREQVISEDVASDPLWVDFAELALRHGLRACWSTPIIDTQGQVLGTFAMYYRRPGRPDANQRALIDVATRTTLIAIHRQRAEQALRESMLVLENMFEHMDQGISITDKELRFFGVNRRFRELLDLPEQLCQPGVPSEALLRYSAERGDYGPGDAEEHVRTRMDRSRHLEAHRFEREQPDGTILEIRGRPIPGGGFVTIYTDITERARSERELQRFRAALDLCTDGIYLVDCKRLTIIDCNEGACHSLGYSRDELVGKGIESIIPNRTRERLSADFATLVEGDNSESTLEALQQRKDGTVFAVDVNRRIHNTPQGPILVAVVRDVSERKRAEERMELRARQQQIIARLGQLALGKLEREPLFDAATRALLEGGADAAALFEFTGAGGQYVIRSAAGDGLVSAVGQTGRASVGLRGRDLSGFVATLAASSWDAASGMADMPAVPWKVIMGSQLHDVLHSEEGGYGVLGAYALRENAFGEDDRRFVQTVSALLSTAMQRLQSEQRLAYLAQFDTLTGLPNRNLLVDRLKRSVIHASRGAQRLGVLFLDIDHFKLVNDTLGHHMGDRLIAMVGQRITTCVRAGDTVGRISGDEFAAVLPELAQPDDAALVARKILDAFSAPFDLDGHETFVSTSIGIAVYPDDDKDADRLLKDADAAMYRAKETGRGRYCFYTADLHTRSVAKLQLTNDLRRAIERREYCLYYQPKIDLASGALAGMEALIRWQHPQRGLVAPMEFIPALEESGLIMQVGEWVIEETCAQLRRWIDAGLAVVPISVNVSARQFRKEDLPSTIQRHITAAGIAPSLIDLEITESCLMDKPKKAVKVLEALSAAGIKLSIDDFGTGYSSLAYLTRFPLTALKIDRSFVRDLHTRPDAGAIARAIIDMAHTLRFTVVAEGIETEGQAEFLRELGCEQGQGYLFARPAPAHEAVAHLQRAATPATMGSQI